jgi:pyruvate formate lyase activating enzyme
VIIGGLQKTTLIDFPGKVACVVFLVGCNFSCSFCHNKDLVTLSLFKKSKIGEVETKEFFLFLNKRKGVLDGVCITGGEPTINYDLPEFVDKIKNTGFLVKLDTNGSNPDMLATLVAKNKLDFVAMDFKAPLDSYEKVSGKRANKNNFIKSLNTLIDSKIPFEIRTTVVPGIHTAGAIKEMALSLKDAVLKSGSSFGRFSWYLQNFRPVNCLDANFLKIKSLTKKDMEGLLKIAKAVFLETYLRGDV